MSSSSMRRVGEQVSRVNDAGSNPAHGTASTRISGRARPSSAMVSCTSARPARAEQRARDRGGARARRPREGGRGAPRTATGLPDDRGARASVPRPEASSGCERRGASAAARSPTPLPASTTRSRSRPSTSQMLARSSSWTCGSVSRVTPPGRRRAENHREATGKTPCEDSLMADAADRRRSPSGPLRSRLLLRDAVHVAAAEHDLAPGHRHDRALREEPLQRRRARSHPEDRRTPASRRRRCRCRS